MVGQEFQTQKKETVLFAASVSASTDTVLKFELPQDGTLERFSARFYAGQENALRIVPVVAKAGQTLEPIVEYASNGKKYVSGDDDHFVYDLSIPVVAKDQIWLYVSNVDVTYAYDVSVSIVIDYLGGRRRVI